MTGRPMSEVVYFQHMSGRLDNRTILKKFIAMTIFKVSR
jgi:hypothetical protein